MKSYTVNTQGNNVNAAKEAGYHAYYTNGVTAIEIKASDKVEARAIASQFGRVLYIFE